MAETFEAEGGAVVTLRHVPARYVAEILGQHPDPDPPTYEVQTLTGETRVFAHDARSVEQTPGAREQWAAYERDRAAQDRERTRALHRFLFVQGIADDPPPVDEWPVDFRRWGLEPPDPADDVEYKVRWVEEVLCPTPRQLLDLILKLYAMSGMSERRLKTIEGFFRLALEGEGP